MVSAKKNGFIRGYFSSIERNISFYPLNQEVEDSITAYIENAYPNLVLSRPKGIARNRAAFDAFQRGLNEGRKVSINTTIKDYAPKIDAIGIN